MVDVETVAAQLHNEVFQEMSRGRCSNIRKDEVVRCVENVLRELGFTILDLCLASLDGEPVQDVEFARYIRVEARHPQTGSSIHIFTFAIFKHGELYNVIYLQSAIKPI